MFIVIEGMDGSGKTTQAVRLSKTLPNAKYMRHPSGNYRELIMMDDTTRAEELFLFAADFAHNSRKIFHDILHGTAVVCDRYVPSFFAYQHALKKFDKKFIRSILENSQLLVPDILIILDTNISVAKERILSRNANNAKDNHTLEEWATLSNYYKQEAIPDLFEAKNCKIINGNNSEDVVHNEIMDYIMWIKNASPRD